LHSVNEEHPNEEAALNKCNAAVSQVGRIVEDVENTLSQGKRTGKSNWRFLPWDELSDDLLF